MAKITIIIEDKKDEKNNPKIELTFDMELSQIEDKYYASLEMPPETLVEKVGFIIFQKIVKTCRKITQGEDKNEA